MLEGDRVHQLKRCEDLWVVVSSWGIGWVLGNTVSESYRCECDVSSSGLGKSALYEIGEPFFIGCVHGCVQDFVGEK